jgi:hypothetical protein
MTLRELLLKELDVLVRLIPEYRREFNHKFSVMRSVGSENAFKSFVDAWTTLKSAEDRIEFINDVLGEASD